VPRADVIRGISVVQLLMDVAPRVPFVATDISADDSVSRVTSRSRCVVVVVVVYYYYDVLLRVTRASHKGKEIN